MSSSSRPVVLTFVGNYLPGYKAGGILRTVVNTVDHLSDEFEFRIVTRDRDLGDAEPYKDIKRNHWQQVGNALVYYLAPDSISLKGILNVMLDTPHQVLYLNSFFDPFTVWALLNIRLGAAAPPRRVIVAPRGEFAWASLKQKYPKKFLFMQAARLTGLYRNVTWHASSEFEALDIVRVMKIRPAAIHVAFDFPIKHIPGAHPDNRRPSLSSDRESLRVVFLSRIAREKNLDYALKILRTVTANVVFDIYGPAPDEAYWGECRELIKQLPANVTVNYGGPVDPGQVLQTFGNYDLFLFPTGGEAYGHVIAECLIAGTPILVDTETAWRNLQVDGLGWDVDLGNEDGFVDVIEELARSDIDARSKMRTTVKANVMARLLNPAMLEANRRLFGVR